MVDPRKVRNRISGWQAWKLREEPGRGYYRLTRAWLHPDCPECKGKGYYYTPTDSVSPYERKWGCPLCQQWAIRPQTLADWQAAGRVRAERIAAELAQLIRKHTPLRQPPRPKRGFAPYKPGEFDPNLLVALLEPPDAPGEEPTKREPLRFAVNPGLRECLLTKLREYRDAAAQTWLQVEFIQEEGNR